MVLILIEKLRFPKPNVNPLELFTIILSNNMIFNKITAHSNNFFIYYQ